MITWNRKEPDQRPCASFGTLQVHLLSDRSADITGQLVQVRFGAGLSLLSQPGAMQKTADGVASSLASVEDAFNGVLRKTRPGRRLPRYRWRMDSSGRSRRG